MGVAAAGFLGWAEAVVGDIDAAAARAERVVQMAREIRHPFSLALALVLACEIHEGLAIPSPSGRSARSSSRWPASTRTRFSPLSD
jgi:hypothetical protein